MMADGYGGCGGSASQVRPERIQLNFKASNYCMYAPFRSLTHSSSLPLRAFTVPPIVFGHPVSPAPAPDPPPNYLLAFLVRRRVNPHAETHLGQSFHDIRIASPTFLSHSV